MSIFQILAGLFSNRQQRAYWKDYTDGYNVNQGDTSRDILKSNECIFSILSNKLSQEEMLNIYETLDLSNISCISDYVSKVEPLVKDIGETLEKIYEQSTKRNH